MARWGKKAQGLGKFRVGMRDRSAERGHRCPVSLEAAVGFHMQIDTTVGCFS